MYLFVACGIALHVIAMAVIDMLIRKNKKVSKNH